MVTGWFLDLFRQKWLIVSCEAAHCTAGGTWRAGTALWAWLYHLPFITPQ